MPPIAPADVVVSVDTHKHVHAAIALSGLGARLGTITVPASLEGYRELEAWACSFGIVGTGSYGAGLARAGRARARRRRGEPPQPPAAPPAGQERPARRGERRPCRAGRPGHGPPEERHEHGRAVDALTDACAPGLKRAHGIATGTAAEMLILVGDNSERIRSEAAFAKLCGTCPVPASSGKTTRHRLNRGGNRQANAALYRVVITRMRSHPPTLA